MWMPARWPVETLDATVDAEIAALPGDVRARLSRIRFLIEDLGLERLREPYVRHLEGWLWEIRLRGRDQIARALLHHGHGPAGRHCAGFHQEDREDALP